MSCDITIVAPDSTAIVQDQDGTELARRDIASGASDTIVVNTGGAEPLYAYNYGALNTGQDVSYATGDDKWVRDNVFNPEIASWPTDRPLAFPLLSQTDFTKLVRGATPEGTNIFGNLERFTDTLGGQIYANDLVIDHYTGLMFSRDSLIINQAVSSWSSYINFVNNLSIGDYNDFHGGNTKEWSSLIIINLSNQLNYNPINFTTVSSGGNSTTNLWTSTTATGEGSNISYQNLINFNNSYALVTRDKNNVRRIGLVFRKAFTYEPATDTTKLILS